MERKRKKGKRPKRTRRALPKRRSPLPMALAIAGVIAFVLVGGELLLRQGSPGSSSSSSREELIEETAIEDAKERYADMVRLGRKGDDVYQEILAEERVRARRFYAFADRVRRIASEVRTKLGGSQEIYERTVQDFVAENAAVEQLRPGAFSDEAVRWAISASVEADVEAERAAGR